MLVLQRLFIQTTNCPPEFEQTPQAVQSNIIIHPNNHAEERRYHSSCQVRLNYTVEWLDLSILRNALDTGEVKVVFLLLLTRVPLKEICEVQKRVRAVGKEPDPVPLADIANFK